MGALIDLTGQRFGRLTVICRVDNIGTRAAWKAKCDCGNTKAVAGHELKNNHTRSCGCLHAERLTTHGLSKSPEYPIWRAMLRRCSSVRDPRYHDYGGRGITVCERWSKFENFIVDMGFRPLPELTLERVDNDGNYEPSNCKWATWAEQSRNKRMRSDNTSGIVGVSTGKDDTWRAQMWANGKSIYLYEGHDLFEACCARKSAELQHRRVGKLAL